MSYLIRKHFSGRVSDADGLVLPSLHEEGNDVILDVGQGVEHDDKLWDQFNKTCFTIVFRLRFVYSQISEHTGIHFI